MLENCKNVKNERFIYLHPNGDTINIHMFQECVGHYMCRFGNAPKTFSDIEVWLRSQYTHIDEDVPEITCVLQNLWTVWQNEV